VRELSRDRVLSADEIRWFWRACDAVGYPFGAIGKLCLLTGQRRDEVGEMTMDELDLPGHLWAFARDRAKNDERQEVPLSSAALAVIESLPKDKPTRKARKVTDGPAKRYLFTTTGSTPVSGWSRAKANLDGLMLDYARQETTGRGADPDAVTIEHWTMHDLRRTADTGMARLGILPHVIDKVMNHRNGTISGVRAVYNRYDYAAETRQALELWGCYVLALVEGKGEVQLLRAAE
jgi:integrase